MGLFFKNHFHRAFEECVKVRLFRSDNIRLRQECFHRRIINEGFGVEVDMDHSGDNNQWVAKESEGVEQIPPFSHLLFYNPVEGSIIRGQVFINYIPVVIPQRMIPKG